MTIISYRRRFLFVHIMKCGGSSVHAAWQRNAAFGDLVVGGTREGETLQDILDPMYGLTKHLEAEKLREGLGSDYELFESYSMIREPLKVIESWYRYGKTKFFEFVDERKDLVPSKETSFEGAVEYFADRLEKDGEAYDFPKWWFNAHGDVILRAVKATSFNDFAASVCDDRWSNYLRRFVSDKDGKLIVGNIIRLEDKDGATSMLRKYGIALTDLPKENASRRFDTSWDPDLRKTYMNLLSDEYEFWRSFG